MDLQPLKLRKSWRIIVSYSDVIDRVILYKLTSSIWQDFPNILVMIALSNKLTLIETGVREIT